MAYFLRKKLLIVIQSFELVVLKGGKKERKTSNCAKIYQFMHNNCKPMKTITENR